MRERCDERPSGGSIRGEPRDDIVELPPKTRSPADSSYKYVWIDMMVYINVVIERTPRL
jgi:hypothetical protein